MIFRVDNGTGDSVGAKSNNGVTRSTSTYQAESTCIRCVAEFTESAFWKPFAKRITGQQNSTYLQKTTGKFCSVWGKCRSSHGIALLRSVSANERKDHEQMAKSPHIGLVISQIGRQLKEVKDCGRSRSAPTSRTVFAAPMQSERPRWEITGDREA